MSPCLGGSFLRPRTEPPRDGRGTRRAHTPSVRRGACNPSLNGKLLNQGHQVASTVWEISQGLTLAQVQPRKCKSKLRKDQTLPKDFAESRRNLKMERNTDAFCTGQGNIHKVWHPSQASCAGAGNQEPPLGTNPSIPAGLEPHQ